MDPDPFSLLAGQRLRPTGRALMRQSWCDLAFLHRKVDPQDIQALLPNGLSVDTFDGSAYIGLVAFSMRDVRLEGFPPLPAHRAFLETNIRTYVRDEGGRPGVWFFSLDCDDRLSVRVARRWFGLNYLDAYLTLGGAEGQLIYSGGRQGAPGADYWIRCRLSGTPSPAPLNSLEFWLVERYTLFALRRGRLISGQVCHDPYRIQPLAVEESREGLILATTGLVTGPDWDHAVFSPGVDVEVFGARRVRVGGQ
ncbi:MAG: DUF2071 domain-containing protein [Armatimonadetes bacterium]|nr:DUF2071 domain-containing protein [Armatimonadota bacterium]MBS1711527.1 DUF2071 domain-containing protein [Armatimonadota bacterium]MBX3107548.1 DUF2071 domain-containing protein [Fimbriimonadaceae bacterium]